MRLGVVGGGTMGAGIAHVFLVAGADVAVIEADDERSRRSRSAIEDSLRRAVERGHLADAGGPVSRLTTAADVAGVAGSDLVIEAVPEEMDLKRDVLRRIEKACSRDAVMATNTSSLSIDALAEAIDSRDRFIGMHFFNPVPASDLVELVLGAGTTRETAGAAREWVRMIGKESIEVRDSPGFASSRLGVAIGLEAIRMLEEGVASAEDIDRAMVLGYKFPVGPLRLTDLVGLDTRLSIAEYLTATLGERFAPPALLREKVARGELGRKTGKGFYEW